MRFEGTHTTRYTYSAPAFIEPSTVRLRPRSDPWQRLERFEMCVTPEPGGTAEGTDANGNPAAWLWFEGTHPALEIETRFVVSTLRTNPFDYVLPHEDLGRLPMSYPDMPGLAPFLAPDPGSGAVDELIEEIDEDHVLGFLAALATHIYERFEVVVRPEGDPWTASETLRKGLGSCRDLTVLYVEACRRRGIAARFVSGYQEGDPDQAERELHAWAEAYIPGGGWRPYDPTHGLAVSDAHVALAAGPEPADAAPVSGTFRGTGVEARMDARITLDVTRDGETASGTASL